MTELSLGHRIVVVGTTGAGKTTMAQTLADLLGVPHIELDALYWEAGWEPASDELFRRRVTEAVAAPAWVVDGNYSRVRDLVWARAESVVWLDYALPVILWRLWWRTSKRVLSQEKLWGKNRETLRGAFFSRDSLFVWALKTYRRRRRGYQKLFGGKYAHMPRVHLTTPRAAGRFLARVAGNST